MIEFPYKIEQCVWELKHDGVGSRWQGQAGGQAGDELSLTECLHVAEQLIEQGCARVTLIGDRLLAYEGWDRIARRLTDAGVAVDAITNAVPAGPGQFAHLRRARLSRVGVAIDGMAECHDQLHGRAGAFRQAVDLVNALLAQGFSVTVVTTVTDRAIDDLPALYDLLIARGVRSWQIRTPSASPSRSPARAAISPSHMQEVSRFIDAAGAADKRMKIQAANEVGCVDPGLPRFAGATRECQAGLKGLGIDSKGNVKGCQALADSRFIEGNLRTQTLAEIWRRPSAFAYNRRFHAGQLEGRCAGCDTGRLCRAGCRSTCFFITGSLFENPYCCRPASPVAQGAGTSEA